MTIRFYNNQSELNKLSKNITEVTSVTGSLREESSILHPSILVELTVNQIQFINYAYIPEFNRYYFVTDITSARNGLWRVSMDVDVLMTYRNDIRRNVAIIARNEAEYNLLLNDGVFKTDQKPRIATFTFPNGFTTQNYILALSGSQ